MSDVHASRPLNQERRSSSRKKTMLSGINASDNAENVNPQQDGDDLTENSQFSLGLSYQKSKSNNAENANPQQDNDLTESSKFSLGLGVTSQKKKKAKASTPSKRTDAGFFFQNLPKTPLHAVLKSAKKKHHRTHKLDTSYFSDSSEESAGKVDELFSSASNHKVDESDSMDSSTDRAMAELKAALDDSPQNENTNNSENSIQPYSDSSSSGGGSGDMLSRSVLSDTTEITASNFVFVAKSKQCLLEVAREEKKRKKKEQDKKMPARGDGDGEEPSSAAKEAKEANNLKEPSPPVVHQETNEEPEQLALSFLETETEPSKDRMEKEGHGEGGEEASTVEENPNNLASRKAFKNVAKPPAIAKPPLAQPLELQDSARKARDYGRKSLLVGPSPSNLKSRVQVSPGSLRKFSASLMRSRQQSQYERDQDIKQRLSTGSAVKQPPRARPPSLIGLQEGNTIHSRLSLGSAFAAVGLNALGSANCTADRRESSSSGNSEMQKLDLSSKLAQSPFESAEKSTRAAPKNPSSGTARRGSSSSGNSEMQNWNLSSKLIQSPFESAQRSVQAEPQNSLEAFGSSSASRSSTDSPDDDRGILNWNLSNQLAQSPFDSEQKDTQKASPDTKPAPLNSPQAPEIPTAFAAQSDYENTAEINFDYNEWIRRPLQAPADQDLASSAQESHSAAVLRRLSRNETDFLNHSDASSNEGSNHDNHKQSEDDDMSGRAREEHSLDHKETSVDHNEKQNSVGFSPKIPSVSKASPDDDASRSSIDKIFEGLDFDDDSKHSNESFSKEEVARRSPVRDSPDIPQEPMLRSPPPAISVARESHDASSENAQRSVAEDGSQSPSSPGDDHTSMSGRRTPNSASKLTPSKLSKRPRRWANPNSLLSPAHNTRSAKKRKQNLATDSVGGASARSNHFFSSDPLGSSEKEKNRNVEANTSFASSISSGESRRSSVTASLADIGEIFDFVNDSTWDSGERRRSMATSKRRETASFSDFGEALAFLDGDDDDESSKSKVNSSSNRRRSSMFRSSLASLPEKAALDLDSSNGGSTSSGDKRKKENSKRKSSRRKSSLFMPRIPSQDESSGDEEDKSLSHSVGHSSDEDYKSNKATEANRESPSSLLGVAEKYVAQSEADKSKKTTDEGKAEEDKEEIALKKISDAKAQQPLHSPDSITRGACKQKSQSPQAVTETENDQLKKTSSDEDEAEGGSDRKEVTMKKISEAKARQPLDSPARNTRSACKKKLQSPNVQKENDSVQSMTKETEQGLIESEPKIPEQNNQKRGQDILQNADAILLNPRTRQNPASDKRAMIRAVDSPARNTRSASKTRQLQALEQPTDPFSFFERLTQSQESPVQEKENMMKAGVIEEGTSDATEPLSNNKASRQEDNSERENQLSDKGGSRYSLNNSSTSGKSTANSKHSRGSDTATFSELGSLFGPNPLESKTKSRDSSGSSKSGANSKHSRGSDTATLSELGPLVGSKPARTGLASNQGSTPTAPLETKTKSMDSSISSKSRNHSRSCDNDTAILSELGLLLGSDPTQKNAESNQGSAPRVPRETKAKFLDSCSCNSSKSTAISNHSRSSDNDTATFSELGALLGSYPTDLNEESDQGSTPSIYQETKATKRPRSSPSPSPGLDGDDNARSGKRIRSTQSNDMCEGSGASVSAAVDGPKSSPLSSVASEELHYDRHQLQSGSRIHEEDTETASLGDIGDLLGRTTAEESSHIPASRDSRFMENRSPSSQNDSEPTSVMKQPMSSRKPPRSALKKAKAVSVKKSVGFKSPEAAEYDIGSSVAQSLTPMPRNTAKALFTIPPSGESGPESGGDMSFASSTDSGDSGDKSLATLSSKCSASSPQHAQAAAAEDRTVTLELNLPQLLNNIGESNGHEGLTQSSGNDSSLEKSHESEEMTIELESDLQGMLAVTAGKPKSMSDSPGEDDMVQDDSLLSSSRESADSSAEMATGEDDMVQDDSLLSSSRESAESSTEMADSRCIVSINVPPVEGDRQLMAGQRLAFDDSLAESSPSISNNETSQSQDEDQTLELEGNMQEMLGVEGQRAELEVPELGCLDVSAIPRSSPGDTGTLPLQSQLSDYSDMGGLDSSDTGGLSSFSDSSTSASVKAIEDVTCTVQLENNIDEMLDAVVGNDAGVHVEDSRNQSPSFTAQLEENIAMVLQPNTVGQGQQIMDSGLDLQSTPGSCSLKTRRSSVSSHNLSLIPQGRLSISKTGDISVLADSSSDGNEPFVEPSNDSSDDHHADDISAGGRTTTFDMDGEEVLNCAGLGKEEDAPFKLQDVIIEFASQLQGSTTDEFTSLLLSICEELENKIEDIPDLNVAFEELTEDKAELFLNLQHQLRDPGDITTREEVQYLACAINETGHLEWANWLAVVMESFKGSFGAIIDSIKEGSEELATGLNHIDQAHEKQGRIADASARRARRKSMSRRKNVSENLEDDIKDLEEEIARVQEELDSAKSQEAKTCEMQLALTGHQATQTERLAVGSQTALSKARSEYFTGMFRWKAARLTKPQMAFELKGKYPESSASLKFTIGDQIGCCAKIDPAAFQQRADATKRLSHTSVACLKKSVGEILKTYSGIVLQTPAEIGPLLSVLDVRIGRLEELALEINDLENQHETNVSFVRGNVSFEVEFSKCVASFEVKPTYPFEPMTVRVDVLEGEFNERKLKRHLVKQVKPGRQYLTRLCGCMATYLDGSR